MGPTQHPADGPKALSRTPHPGKTPQRPAEGLSTPSPSDHPQRPPKGRQAAIPKKGQVRGHEDHQRAAVLHRIVAVKRHLPADAASYTPAEYSLQRTQRACTEPGLQWPVRRSQRITILSDFKGTPALPSAGLKASSTANCEPQTTMSPMRNAFSAAGRPFAGVPARAPPRSSNASPTPTSSQEALDQKLSRRLRGAVRRTKATGVDSGTRRGAQRHAGQPIVNRPLPRPRTLRTTGVLACSQSRD